MRIFITVVLFLTFASLFVGWALLERKKSSPRLWVGFIAIVVSVPIAYFAGVLSTSFDDNLCYSEAIKLIQEGQGSGKPLPLNGYETNCDEILSALAAQ